MRPGIGADAPGRSHGGTMEPLTVELRSSVVDTITSKLTDSESYVLGDDGLVVPEKRAGRSSRLRLTRENNLLFVAPGADGTVLVNGKPVTDRTAVQHGDWVSINGMVYQLKLTLGDADATPAAQPAPPRTAATAINAAIVIGRDPKCAFAIDSPLVSREHAQLLREGAGWQIEDLRSTNGVFVNGRRITRRTALKPGDRVGIATFLFRFTGTELLADGEDGRVRIEAVNITKEVRDRSTKQSRKLLDNISLVIEPGEFVVIFGGSGSGKSTLLDTLNGRRPASSGQVLYNGTNFYTAFDMFRATIGYVPQQDIVHRRLKVRRALEYAARLRLPPDTAPAEIASYTDEVLKSVRLQEQAELAIDTPAPLSGGQLKRVSLAAELIAKPSVLFLDEVTSGLDAGTDRQMMQTFAELADSGKTLICVTHTLENIAACDLVALLHRGRLAYYGPPREVCGYFNIERLSDIYETLDTQTPEHWAAQFERSSYQQRYVTARMSSQAQAPSASHTTQASTIPPVRTRFWSQTAILTRRNIDLLLADKRNLAILLLQAPLIGGVVGTVFNTRGALAAQAVAQSQIAFMLVLSAIWFGCLNSAREIVKELPVYLRERSVNLKLWPYLLSKLGPLAVICVIQAALLLCVVTSLIALPGEFLARLGLLTLTAFAATTMGLAISSFVDSNDKAIGLVPILLIPQVVLSNAVARLDGISRWVAKFTMVSYWAYDALKSTLSAAVLAVTDASGAAVVPVLGSFGQSVCVIALMAASFIALALLGLRLKDRRT